MYRNISLNSSTQSNSNSSSESVETGNTNQESFDRDFKSLNFENQGFFSRMSESARNLASQAYEGLYKIPVMNSVVGKTV